MHNQSLLANLFIDIDNMCDPQRIWEKKNP